MIRYVHTNIVARDWRRLAQFYRDVFGCEPVPPERDLEGDWLDRGAGYKGLHLTGMHLRLPGHGQQGPTLEIFSYDRLAAAETKPACNRPGYSHLAFAVDDVAEVLGRLLTSGGSRIGEVAEHLVSGVGVLTFVYAADPEGNIIELQNWKKD